MAENVFGVTKVVRKGAVITSPDGRIYTLVRDLTTGDMIFQGDFKPVGDARPLRGKVIPRWLFEALDEHALDAKIVKTDFEK